jgi:phosphatidylglycerol lysyltransferase
MRIERRLHALLPLISVAAFLVALWVLRRELHHYSYHQIVGYLEELPAGRILFAVLLTAASYLLLTGYDALGFVALGKRLEYRKIAFASFIGYGFSNSVGHTLISGGSIRYRLYSGWGLSAVEVTAVVAFCDLALWLGYLTLGGIVFLLEPVAVPAALHLPLASVRPIGALFLALVVLYFAWSVRRRAPLRFRQWELPLPSTRLALAATALACLDWTVAGSVLYALLPPEAGIGFAAFLGAYLLAQTVGMISQVPAGLGVFETMMLLLLTPRLDATVVLGSLLAFRGLYYLLPLSVATLLLGASEVLRRQSGVRRVAQSLGQWVPGMVPHLFAFSTFVAGAVLLFSGATPAETERLRWLKDFVPLPVVEFSHFLGSLAGVALLFLARGLQRRLDGAYVVTVGLLAAGIVFSLLKGVDYEEALLLFVMLAALLPCRREFYRKASLISQRFTAGWVVAIVLVLACSIWLGFFSYKHVEYSGDLWWRFAFRANAPRFLRATVGAIGLALVLAVGHLLRPAPAEPGVEGEDDIERALPIVRSCRATAANLALLGDKRLLFSDSGRSLVMFGVTRRSWIALGPPLGDPSERAELAWRFRELCDLHDAWTVFYQVDQEDLPLLLDLGLTLQKLGEEARVPLERFSLEGGHRKGLRNLVHRVEREACRFEVVPVEAVPALLPELRAVSDAWLAEKRTREKGFSLGFFDEPYLARFPVALVRREERILAFANLWLGAEREEISVDLMRFPPEAPAGIMEYLFVEIMLYGQRQGYRWFNLGMAPLSGLENRAMAPLWNRLGALVFRHGEQFYNFQGLRQYKEKFAPVWEPKYLASPGGVALPRALADLSSLISGGLKGVIAK